MFGDLCSLPQVAERYDDMVTIVKAMARARGEAMTGMCLRPLCARLLRASLPHAVLHLLSTSAVEQRNLFSVAFKNVVGALRASWRVLDSIRESKDVRWARFLTASRRVPALCPITRPELICALFAPQDADQVAQAVEFQADLEAELRKVCGELLELVDRKGEEMDGAVFFQKMAGDYHRYMAEIEAGKEKGGNPEHARNALDAYTRAYDLVRQIVLELCWRVP